MDKIVFYKDLYDKEIDRYNNISNSLSTTIGIISAFVVGLFYFITTFNPSISPRINIIFFLFFGLCIVFMSLSIFHFVKAFNNFPKGYIYAYLADAGALNNFHKGLTEYHKQLNENIDNSDAEFDDYILQELIKIIDINQNNNELKIRHRFHCHRYIIVLFFMMCILTVPYGINFATDNSKTQIQKIVIDSTLNINIQSPQLQPFIDDTIKNSNNMADDKDKKVERPIPPPTKLIQEGKEVRTNTKIQTNKGKKEKGK